VILPEKYFENLKKKYFTLDEKDFIPKEFKQLLRNI
jgi:hypothetical protein